MFNKDFYNKVTIVKNKFLQYFDDCKKINSFCDTKRFYMTISIIIINFLQYLRIAKKF